MSGQSERDFDRQVAELRADLDRIIEQLKGLDRAIGEAIGRLDDEDRARDIVSEAIAQGEHLTRQGQARPRLEVVRGG